MQLARNISVETSIPVDRHRVVVPQRICEKINALRTALYTEDRIMLRQSYPSLINHIELVLGAASRGYEPNLETTFGDMQHLALLCTVENKRKPGLNLRYLENAFCSETEKFDLHEIDRVIAQGVGSYRFIVTPDHASPPHHCMIDVRMQAGDTPISAVIFESLSGFQYVEPIVKAFADRNIPVITIINDVQQSSVDCAMFALAHALKAKESVFINNIHDKICDSGNRDNFQATTNALGINRQEEVFISPDGDMYFSTKKQYYIEPTQVPAIFQKHIQSKTDLMELKSQISQRVNSTKHAQSETLEQRLHAFYARHLFKSFSSQQYRVGHAFSASLQGFRLKEFLRAINYLQNQTFEHVWPSKRLQT